MLIRWKPFHRVTPTLPQNPFILLRNLFGIESELRNEKTFAELLETLILLSPLIELPTIKEDISCAPATINLLDTIAELKSLFPLLQEILPSTASPTPSSLFTVEHPIGPSKD